MSMQEASQQLSELTELELYYLEANQEIDSAFEITILDGLSDNEK